MHDFNPEICEWGSCSIDFSCPPVFWGQGGVAVALETFLNIILGRFMNFWSGLLIILYFLLPQSDNKPVELSLGWQIYKLLITPLPQSTEGPALVWTRAVVFFNPLSFSHMDVLHAPVPCCRATACHWPANSGRHPTFLSKPCGLRKSVAIIYESQRGHPKFSS